VEAADGVSPRLDKGINGGKIVIKPYTGKIFDTSRNVIIGNTCLYGATGGYLYANGRAPFATLALQR
jgi:glutamate synthase domain-containing protein 3